jgi:glycosyltransferase involved in cell wall biosynthesis
MDVSGAKKINGSVLRHTVSAVVPALNEEKNIAWVLTRLPECVDEVLVVDGRSTDGTIEIARRTRPDVRIVQEMTPGKGAALRAGFAAATGDYVVMLDADGSMEPAEITRYVAMLDEGYDVVKGSRFLAGGGTTDISRLRAMGNLALLAMANSVYGCRFTELCYGYMGFRRTAIEALRLSARGFEIETQIVAHAMRARLRVAEVPSFEAERRSGESNLRTFRDGSRVLNELLTARVRPWPSALDAPARPTRRGRRRRFDRGQHQAMDEPVAALERSGGS